MGLWRRYNYAVERLQWDHMKQSGHMQKHYTPTAQVDPHYPPAAVWRNLLGVEQREMLVREVETRAGLLQYLQAAEGKQAGLGLSIAQAWAGSRMRTLNGAIDALPAGEVLESLWDETITWGDAYEEYAAWRSGKRT